MLGVIMLQLFMLNRGLYYWSKLYGEAISQADPYEVLKQEMEKGMVNVAKAMLAEGEAMVKITRFTGFTGEELERL